VYTPLPVHEIEEVLERDRPVSRVRLFTLIGGLAGIASAFLLTITNPITIFAFTAIFAGFGIVGHDMSLPASWSLIVGVAIGATLWWSGLTLAAGFLRERVAVHELRWLNKLSGGLILVFAAGSFASLALFR